MILIGSHVPDDVEKKSEKFEYTQTPISHFYLKNRRQNAS